MRRTDGKRWAQTLEIAAGYLRQFSDGFTLREREDLAQEAAIAAFLSADLELAPPRWTGLVRVIAHRSRLRAMGCKERLVQSVAENAPAACESAVVADDTEAKCFVVAGAEVSARWLLRELRDCLRTMTPVNRALLLGFYSGAACAELARQYGLREAVIKVRLYRSRQLLRRRLEKRVRVAGFVDPACAKTGSELRNEGETE